MAPQPGTPQGRPSAGYSRGLRTALAAALIPLAGCYSLVPISAETASPPLRVRAHLSPEAAARVEPVLGEVRAAIDGRFVERTDRGIYLEIPVVQTQQGFGTEALTQRLLLEGDDLVGLQQRQLDWTKTGLLAGVAAVALGAVIADMLTGDSGGSGQPPGGGGPPEARIPLFGVPLR